MTKEDLQVFKQACAALGINTKTVMDAKVYPDRVVIIDSIGRKLTVNRLDMPAAKPKPPTRARGRRSTKPKTEDKGNQPEAKTK